MENKYQTEWGGLTHRVLSSLGETTNAYKGPESNHGVYVIQELYIYKHSNTYLFSVFGDDFQILVRFVMVNSKYLFVRQVQTQWGPLSPPLVLVLPCGFSEGHRGILNKGFVPLSLPLQTI